MGEPPRRRTPRLAAGRARALGLPTRGTTNPNRLRLMDTWIATELGAQLRAARDPLVIDLGYGATPVTALELAARLTRIRADVRVLGLELDPDRVAAAQPSADPPRLTFARGGFELAGRRPAIVRAANVLRQYSEADATEAWRTMRAGLADNGLLVEGTCDELGRRACWVLLDAAGPRTVTFAGRIADLHRPGEFAARLPKALIHHNVPGQPVHRLLEAMDTHWSTNATPFGPRQRWQAMGAALRDAGVPVDPGQLRRGWLTVAWSCVAPV